MYTDLPEIWRVYEFTLNTSSVDPEGYPTLTNIQCVINTLDYEIRCTPEQFWESINYFHNRVINNINLKRKKK